MSRRVADKIRQSAPVDTSKPYDISTLNGKTIVVTGGASGFGEGFTRKWVGAGATVIVGDVNRTRGKALEEELRQKYGKTSVLFVYCDVTNWQSQVDLFHEAIKFSPTHGIDGVVANAGISDGMPNISLPENLDAAEPPPPNMKCLDVNLTGVVYTVHLAIFYLPRNPNSERADPNVKTSANRPDRHILLIGSVASFTPLPFATLYNASKHGVMGIFRSLRSTAFFKKGIRVNMLCPYWIDTPIIPTGARLLLAGGAMGKPEDVVDAGTRLMADSSIAGRALAVGPKVKVDDEGQLVTKGSDKGEEKAVWECYADDFEEVDVFSARFVKLLNRVEQVRGWGGWIYDMILVVVYPIRNLLRK